MVVVTETAFVFSLACQKESRVVINCRRCSTAQQRLRATLNPPSNFQKKALSSWPNRTANRCSTDRRCGGALQEPCLWDSGTGRDTQRKGYTKMMSSKFEDYNSAGGGGVNSAGGGRPQTSATDRNSAMARERKRMRGRERDGNSNKKEEADRERARTARTHGLMSPDHYLFWR